MTERSGRWGWSLPGHLIDHRLEFFLCKISHDELVKANEEKAIINEMKQSSRRNEGKSQQFKWNLNSNLSNSISRKFCLIFSLCIQFFWLCWLAFQNSKVKLRTTPLERSSIDHVFFVFGKFFYFFSKILFKQSNINISCDSNPN